MKLVNIANQIINKKHKKLPHDIIFVDGGKLVLGSDNRRDCFLREVEMDSFYISKYEVTQKLYESVIGQNPSYNTGKNKPVECVNWYDAVEFCNKLSEKEGLNPCYKIDKDNKDPNNESEYDDTKWTVTCDFTANGYRLPTEAEWEYAARGGLKSKGFKFAGSDDQFKVSWNAYTADKTHDVGELPPNELGLYDMSGNVWEWCWDWYGSIVTETPLTGPESGEDRVIRGGSFGAYGREEVYMDKCAVDNRNWYLASKREDDIGIRLVRSAK